MKSEKGERTQKLRHFLSEKRRKKERKKEEKKKKKRKKRKKKEIQIPINSLDHLLVSTGIFGSLSGV